MNLNFHQTRLINAFVAEIDRTRTQLYVRGGRAFADGLKATELRTSKHSHLAICWDELGNAFVLKGNGQRLQCLSQGEVAAA